MESRELDPKKRYLVSLKLEGLYRQATQIIKDLTARTVADTTQLRSLYDGILS